MNENWTLTRNDTQQTLHFPQDMQWIDELQWSAVAQSSPERTLSGGLIIQQGIKQSGRPITLAGDWVWLDLGTLRILRDWSDIPELGMTLTHYDGRTFKVAFRLHEQALDNISPVQYSTPENERDRYTAQIALMTV